MGPEIDDLATLADRLRTFRFEEPGAPAFAESLARETGWDALYAERVVEEYRRFLWLARAGEELVSPSPAVDEAWHLHLLDTRSYWERLCPQVLGRPLHHVPSRGDLVAGKRFRAAYARTLEVYARAFGPPPRDIWPAAELGPTGGLARFDPRRALVLPRPAAWTLATVALAGVLLAAAPAALAVLHAGLAGDDVGFLAGLALLTAGFHFTGWRLGRRAAGPNARAADEVQGLDRYDVGYLALGARGVIEVAVTELVCAGMLCVDSARGRLGRSARPAAGLSAIERVVLDSIARSPTAALADQLPSERAVRALVEPALVAAGLVIPPGRRRGVSAWCIGGALAVFALAAAKLAFGSRLGTSQGLPVVAAPAMLAGVLIPLLSLPDRRTRRGDAELARRRAAFGPPLEGSSAGEDFGTLVSLFGASALHTSTLAELGHLLSPPVQESGSACGGCGG